MRDQRDTANFQHGTKPLLIKLDRTVDHNKPCCDNLAKILPGRGPHAAELSCANCNKHRGWLPHQALEFIRNASHRFGASDEPIILRDSSIGDCPLEKSDRGILVRNNTKHGEHDRDYCGSITVAGVEYWLSGWVKEGKKGKYLSLSVKSKDPVAGKSDAVPGLMSD